MRLNKFCPPPPTHSTMRGKYDLHPSHFILCQLLLLLALIHGCHPTARRHNWISFIFVSTLCIYSSESFFCTSSSATADYPFIQVFINLILTSTDYILLRHSHHQPELRKIGQKRFVAEMSFTERLASLFSAQHRLDTQAYIPHPPTAYVFSRHLHPFPNALDHTALYPIRRRSHRHSAKSMLQDQRALVGRFRTEMAHDGVGVHRFDIL